ncbi:hypothetical protein, partial [Salmonella sp. C3262]|uniref:hypothetical protein n=1 Tax=Salmonella sp. C3262 TaxID=2947359 RepID=UPI003F473DC3
LLSISNSAGQHSAPGAIFFPHTGLALASVPIRFVEINRFCCAVDISNILHLVPNHNEGSGKIQTLR